MSFNTRNNEHDDAQEDWSKSDTILVIDGDELAYVMAAACEQTQLEYVNTNNNSKHGFKNKTEFGKFMTGIDIPEGLFTCEMKRVAEPIAVALSQIKRKLYKLQSKFKTNRIEIF